jgi:hypothetical protein
MLSLCGVFYFGTRSLRLILRSGSGYDNIDAAARRMAGQEQREGGESDGLDLLSNGNLKLSRLPAWCRFCISHLLEEPPFCGG